MAENKGRPSDYDKKVKPYLREISRMICNMSRTKVAEELGITYESFRKYIKQYPELEKAVKNGKRDLIIELKDGLIKKAKGYTAEEVREKYEHGNLVEKVVTKKHIPPDIGAINLLLKNLDKKRWANDPQNLELRKQELELKREIAGKEQTIIPVQIVNDIPRPEVNEDVESNSDTTD